VIAIWYCNRVCKCGRRLRSRRRCLRAGADHAKTGRSGICGPKLPPNQTPRKSALRSVTSCLTFLPARQYGQRRGFLHSRPPDPPNPPREPLDPAPPRKAWRGSPSWPSVDAHKAQRGGCALSYALAEVADRDAVRRIGDVDVIGEGSVTRAPTAGGGRCAPAPLRRARCTRIPSG
jgi:hypothetical protein